MIIDSLFSRMTNETYTRFFFYLLHISKYRYHPTFPSVLQLLRTNRTNQCIYRPCHIDILF
ncbi:hypothetical protein PBCV1_a650cR [Paramecium bursaria Chlorella virus 1]|uniref:Uncharacterized protein n=1 Tax=Paramecium bursaria Chlorella virus 1 TaxID=10506 RepID=F8TU82_PBCV1|nr:hypothetical protein PBCV1_a650cR [Paramecium bursaria Chlorella virus 1]AEI70143.1 hypothetical protein [Paramecium bursaria Chlorella virus 1]